MAENYCIAKFKQIGKKRNKWIRLGKPTSLYNGLIRDIKRCGWEVRISNGIWYIK